MKQADETALLILVGIWMLGRYTWQVKPALQRGGVDLYEWAHDDKAHRRDLPGQQLTRQAVLQIATKAGFPDPKLAAAIAFAESGGVPNALNSSRAICVGLWQINTSKWPYTREAMSDPEKNAAAAFVISKGGTDWRAWTTYSNGAYRKFLTGVFE